MQISHMSYVACLFRFPFRSHFVREKSGRGRGEGDVEKGKR